MYIKNKDKATCCGCGACVNICSKKCIKMKEDDNGFLFPKLNEEECVSCGLCEKVCPMAGLITLKETLVEPMCYGFIVNSQEYRNKSASSGAFGKISECIFENESKDLYIWGATINEKFQVEHIYVENVNGLDLLRGSKYVQSNMKNAHKNIKDQLLSGSYVVFSGTPCQVASVKKFVGEKNCENLFCIDLVCHGVPSQRMFDKYLNEFVNKREEIVKFTFRYKNRLNDGAVDSRCVEVQTISGETYVESASENAFLEMYAKRLGLRDSCYTCPFANKNRVGDLTIKDFWNVKKFYPVLDVHDGINIILANTEKGKKVIEKLRKRSDVTFLDVDYNKYIELAKHGCLATPTKKPNTNDKFLRMVKNDKFADAVKVCSKPSFVVTVKRLIKKVF